jgi:hypothetical protein
LECIPELEALLTDGKKEIVMGSRVRLLGREIERNEARHYAGRLFATFASNILGLKVYDTQCGAKLFRLTDRLRRVFGAPFTVGWIFDVEILARFLLLERSPVFKNKTEEITVEYPLQKWIDQKGSKVGLKDFVVSGWELFNIYLVLHIYKDNHPYMKRLWGR